MAYGNNNFNNPWSRFIDNGFDFQQTNGIFTAAGDILPSVFVTITSKGLVRQSIRGDCSLGVSQQNTNAFNTNYAASLGDVLQIYGMGQDCWLLLGETVAAGDKLRSNDLGRGIKVRAYDECWGAYAYQGGNEGDLIRVKVFTKYVDPTCEIGAEFSSEYSYEYGNCY